MKYLITLLVNAVAIFITASLLSGVHISSLWTTIVIAIVLGIVNTILRPIIVFLTLPISMVTLGAFILVINAGLILLAGWIIPGFALDNFWWAFLFGIVNGIIGGILGFFFKPKKQESVVA